MNRYLPVLLLMMFTCCFSSCSLLKHKGKKHKSKGNDTTAIVLRADSNSVVAAPVIDTTLRPHSDSFILATMKSQQQFIDSITPMWAKRLDYKTFFGKAKVHIETPDAGNDFTAHFRIRKDSVIWVSVSLPAIGAVARVFVTRDSIFMIDYFHKEAKWLPLSQIAKILPAAVDFTSLQNLVLGEPLTGGTITNARYEKDSLYMRVVDSNYIQNITYLRADSTMHNELLETTKPSGPKAMSEYGNYQMEGSRKISTSRVLHVNANNVMYLLEMDFSKIAFDEEQDYPFSIPNKYR